METYVKEEYYDGNVVDHYLNPRLKKVVQESHDVLGFTVMIILLMFMK